MGTKENFLQAMRELTGGGKDDKKNDGKSTVDGMRNAVAAEDTSEFMAVTEAAAENNNVIEDFEEIERRAAMAAENLNRQQDSFAQSSYAGDNNAPAEPVESPIRFNEPPQSQFAQQPQQPFVPPQPPLFSQQQYAQQNNTYNQAQQNPYAQQFAGGQTPPPPPQNPQPGIYSNPEPNSFSTATYRQVDENEMTVISRNTVIDGNVRSFANMSIDGNIKGNVETTKDIDLNGKIVGNIACNNASLRTSQIQGNIQMKGNAFMERDTLLIGDLSSTYANVNGKIKGNMSITGKAELKSDAVVFGDISASTITVNDGAIIQGYVSTTFLNKEESKNIFPEAITIGD
ncbi:MAG: polymer-forming cytoskeletal protein [Ruminiclostridium sp.]|nr:polymer-forming cytoskeletal protein [Ruminiclostridium sp.]